MEYGGNTVFLLPSLRAAFFLEQLHGGFPGLLRKLAEFDTATVWHVIKEAAGKDASDTLLAYAATRPLTAFSHAATGPLFALVAALLPIAPKATTTDSDGASVPWADAFTELFKIATGWLGWTPETAWNATPQEITDAFDAHLNKLKALHGAADDEPDSTNANQRAQNIALGLDPEFDRAGLHALKVKSKAREGQVDL
ncbi:hypothetical protein Z945_1614 [Sulfitobacter noctilucae]|nr:hypothetical protein Z945_1614 [Sulfitobacter noctilucae]